MSLVVVNLVLMVGRSGVVIVVGNISVFMYRSIGILKDIGRCSVVIGCVMLRSFRFIVLLGVLLRVVGLLFWFGVSVVVV